MEPMPIPMERPAAGVLTYALAAREDATSPVALRRLSLLNLVCGGLLLAEFPAIVALAVVVGRFNTTRRGRVPPTAMDVCRTVIGQWRNGLLPLGYLVACGLAAVATGWLISRRRGRWFSVVAGYVMCFSLPFGLVAGLPTAIVLMRRRSRTAYQNRRPREGV